MEKKKQTNKLTIKKIATYSDTRRISVYSVLFGFLAKRQSFWFVSFLPVGVATLYWHFTHFIRKFEIRKSSFAQYSQK